jgi:hypothetical protein
MADVTPVLANPGSGLTHVNVPARTLEVRQSAPML